MNKIKALCSVNEITLKRLGEDLKIKQNVLSNYSTEARSLPVETAYEIAKYFDVSMEDGNISKINFKRGQRL